MKKYELKSKELPHDEPTLMLAYENEDHPDLAKLLEEASENSDAKIYEQRLTQALKDPNVDAIFEKNFTHGSLLNDFFSKPGPSVNFEESEFTDEDLPAGKRIAAGVIIFLPDGRLVLTEPEGAFAGYKYAFPKGTLTIDGEELFEESAIREALQNQDIRGALKQTAIREAKEETGLDIRITGVLKNDYVGGATKNRYYIAVPVGGDPGSFDWETHRVRFTSLDRADELFKENRNPILRSIIKDLKEEYSAIYSDDRKTSSHVYGLMANWGWLWNWNPEGKSQNVALGENYLAILEDRPLKNRHHINSLPYDDNRITIRGNEYINASKVTFPGVKHSFIAAQGPLENTVEDFWTMAFEQTEKDGLIVMVTDLSETVGTEVKQKCAQYWPEEINTEKTYGELSVKLMSEENEGQASTSSDEKQTALTRRTFEVSDGKSTKTITQLHQEHWPDHSVIPVDNLKVLIKEIENRVKKNGSPPIVHCSHGVGRAGVVILTSALYLAEDFNILKLILTMREQRPWMVYFEKQAQLALHTAMKLRGMETFSMSRKEESRL